MGEKTPRHFNPQDVLYLIHRGPVVSLSRLGSASAYLKHILHVGDAMSPMLALYPKERMEELEFFYGCLDGLGVLNARLLSDLVHHFAWRGVVWGCWLSCLQPDPTHLHVLQSIQVERPQQWWVKLALSINRGEPPHPDHATLTDLIARCTALIHGLPRPEIPMRPAPNEAEIAVIEAERERVRRLYRAHGADAALELIGKTQAHQHAMSHERWRASTHTKSHDSDEH